jgi:hypothetical protein
MVSLLIDQVLQSFVGLLKPFGSALMPLNLLQTIIALRLHPISVSLGDLCLQNTAAFLDDIVTQDNQGIFVAAHIAMVIPDRIGARIPKPLHIHFCEGRHQLSSLSHTRLTCVKYIGGPADGS